MNARFDPHVSPLAVPQFKLLSTEQCQLIHQATLEVLRRTGVQVHCAEALALLREAGAVVADDGLVRFPPGLVEWALAQAPSAITLCRRGSAEPAVRLSGRNVSFGPGSDCLNYLDPRTGEARKFTVESLVDCIHVVDALPQLSFVMSMGIPADLREANVYRRQFALMLEHTSKPAVFVCDDRADCEAIVAMAAAAAGGSEALRLNPSLLLYSEPSSPLRHSETATGKLLYMAERGLPIVHSPAPMMGGTAPITLAGALVQGNAEILSGLVMHQLKRPGAPFVYGSGTHHMDMRSTICVYGAPEFQLARSATADIARFYGLPNWGYAGHSDSKVMDEQAAADAIFTVYTAFLAGANLVHDVGYLEAGLMTSPQMLVFTAEAVEMVSHFMAGVTLDAESLALDVIQQVGPGGHYLTEAHTLRHFREYWQPSLFDRQRREGWVQDGSTRLGDRLREKTIALMESHRPEPLAPQVKAEIERILSKG